MQSKPSYNPPIRHYEVKKVKKNDKVKKKLNYDNMFKNYKFCIVCSKHVNK